MEPLLKVTRRVITHGWSIGVTIPPRAGFSKGDPVSVAVYPGRVVIEKLEATAQ